MRPPFFGSSLVACSSCFHFMIAHCTRLRQRSLQCFEYTVPHEWFFASQLSNGNGREHDFSHPPPEEYCFSSNTDTFFTSMQIYIPQKLALRNQGLSYLWRASGSDKPELVFVFLRSAPETCKVSYCVRISDGWIVIATSCVYKKLNCISRSKLIVLRFAIMDFYNCWC